LTAISGTKIPDEFRKMSRFLPIVVLIPKSAVCEKTRQKKVVPNNAFAGCGTQ
jgi:hypothetical protein